MNVKLQMNLLIFFPREAFLSPCARLPLCLSWPAPAGWDSTPWPAMETECIALTYARSFLDTDVSTHYDESRYPSGIHIDSMRIFQWLNRFGNALPPQK
jgi:hypothetical protein